MKRNWLFNSPSKYAKTKKCYRLQIKIEGNSYGTLLSFFSDIDGTLVLDHQIVTPLTKRVIRTLQKRDVIFYIATGRMYNLGRVISRQINDDVRIVASNGAVFENGHQMNKHYLGKKKRSKLLTKHV